MREREIQLSGVTLEIQRIEPRDVLEKEAEIAQGIHWSRQPEDRWRDGIT